MLVKFIKSHLSSKEKIRASNFGNMRHHSDDELDALQKKLQALEARSKVKGWPLRILEAVNKEPGLYAIQYANKLGYEKMWFKLHIRKLKNLGLTISLERWLRNFPERESIFRKREMKIQSQLIARES